MELGFVHEPAWAAPPSAIAQEDLELRRRSFRRNLFLLFSLTLAAFILTAWILGSRRFAIRHFSTGPRKPRARAAFASPDRGELRPAYDISRKGYRQQIKPFDVW